MYMVYGMVLCDVVHGIFVLYHKMQTITYVMVLCDVVYSMYYIVQH